MSSEHSYSIGLAFQDYNNHFQASSHVVRAQNTILPSLYNEAMSFTTGLSGLRGKSKSDTTFIQLQGSLLCCFKLIDQSKQPKSHISNT